MTTPIVPSITDDELDSIREYVKRQDKSDNSPVCIDFRELRGLVSRLQDAERDAARYRWISENASIDWKLDYKNIEIVFPVDSDGFDYLDDLVDLAMEQQP